MKTFPGRLLFALLVSASGCTKNSLGDHANATGDDIAVSSTVTTNKMGSVTYKDYFTRGGKTNLTRTVMMTNGVVASRLHTFWHNGRRVASHRTTASGHTSVGNYGGYSVSFHSTNDILTDVFVDDKDYHFLESFSITNGVLTPMSAAEWRKAVGKSALDAEKGKE